MRKLLSLLAIAAFASVFTSNTAQAQESKHVVKVNLFSAVASTINVGYEFAFAEKVSGQLGFAYTAASSSGTKLSGYQIQPEARFYLSDGESAPAGLYISPAFRYRSFSLSSGGDKATWNSVGGSFVVGGQWLFANDHFALNVFGGPAYYSHSFDYEDGATEDDFSLRGSGGFSFRTGAMIGFAF